MRRGREGGHAARDGRTLLVGNACIMTKRSAGRPRRDDGRSLARPLGHRELPRHRLKSTLSLVGMEEARSGVDRPAHPLTPSLHLAEEQTT